MDSTEYQLRREIAILTEKINLIANHIQIGFINEDDPVEIQLIDYKNDTE